MEGKVLESNMAVKRLIANPNPRVVQLLSYPNSSPEHNFTAKLFRREYIRPHTHQKKKAFIKEMVGGNLELRGWFGGQQISLLHLCYTSSTCS